MTTIVIEAMESEMDKKHAKFNGIWFVAQRIMRIIANIMDDPLLQSMTKTGVSSFINVYLTQRQLGILWYLMS